MVNFDKSVIYQDQLSHSVFLHVDIELRRVKSDFKSFSHESVYFFECSFATQYNTKKSQYDF